jgi:hypothetical protein
LFKKVELLIEDEGIADPRVENLGIFERDLCIIDAGRPLSQMKS